MSELEKFELDELTEGLDLEVKKAAGRDGNGELPGSFWETYSAMANSYGGSLLLGIEELPSGKFAVTGIQNIARVVKSIFDNQHNRKSISQDLLSDKMIEILNVDGKKVIRIVIPRARRNQRPVYVGTNPLTGTYRRNNEGDYHCDESTVKRMLAEQMEEASDSRLLEGFGFEDLCTTTLVTYRTQFKTTKPDHPWNDLSDIEFLRRIGGWSKDRQSGIEALTVAGILMFGKLRPILDAIPYYCVDYQERPEAKTEARWIDRVTTDGTWSGNLFDFYKKTIQRLLADLKIPFQIEGDRRLDDTLIHQALREALVNTLIHADYSGRVSILVVKRPDLFGFRNPGMMRVPREDAVKGGISDCRNRSLQKMFQLVGLAEQAGSGIPKIYQSWQQQSWRLPEFDEKVEPEQTVLFMHTLSLLPDKILAKLDDRFGDRFRQLSESQRLALVEVELEGSITHARLKEISSAHARDLTLALQALVRDDFLESDGGGKKSCYYFPGQPPTLKNGGSQHLPTKDGEIGSILTIGPVGSQHLKSGSQHLEDGLKLLEELPEKLRAAVFVLRGTGKAPRAEITDTILGLCEIRFFTLKELAVILDRNPLTIQNHYLSDLVKKGRLLLRYPDKPNHPDQGYQAIKK
jgi:ATP-dependent DNA helicase RecG